MCTVRYLAHLKPDMEMLCGIASTRKQNGEPLFCLLNNTGNMALLTSISKALEGPLIQQERNATRRKIFENVGKVLSRIVSGRENVIMDSVNISSIASACLKKDVEATMAFIKDSLMFDGHIDVPQDTLRKIYMAVKEEQFSLMA